MTPVQPGLLLIIPIAEESNELILDFLVLGESVVLRVTLLEFLVEGADEGGLLGFRHRSQALGRIGSGTSSTLRRTLSFLFIEVADCSTGSLGAKSLKIGRNSAVRVANGLGAPKSAKMRQNGPKKGMAYKLDTLAGGGLRSVAIAIIDSILATGTAPEHEAGLGAAILDRHRAVVSLVGLHEPATRPG